MSFGSKPDNFSRYGFENAPLSKLLVLASGAVTVNYLLMPKEYSTLLHLHWPLVTVSKEVWRLITSQFAYESTFELLCGSALMYNLRILERQWGTRKFASFIFASSSITIGSHFLANYFEWISSYVPVSKTLAGGLYGPIFALMFYYAKDVYCGSVLPRHNNISMGSKLLSYLIAMKMMLLNKSSLVASILGLLSGVLYRLNFVYVSKWLCIPTRISQLTQAVYDWFQVGSDKKSNHCKSFYGATAEIHDDMVYDYLSRWQMSQGGFESGPRPQVGQGYMDNLQPRGTSLQEFLDNLGASPNGHTVNQWEQGDTTSDSQANQIRRRQLETDQESENEKIERLVEMGFTHDAVVGALEESNHNVERATNILLSRVSI
ncbi:ubiquitin-associated domain-containing protein 2-like isoform X2 [Rhopilema esculentum]|uniref:ubiquitin-associated domain-containing protein 2-like isoform X2 n=1 Tax=Rhopilema esculentum TaxID=499914 RepID=UPI0031D8B26F